MVLVFFYTYLMFLLNVHLEVYASVSSTGVTDTGNKLLPVLLLIFACVNVQRYFNRRCHGTDENLEQGLITGENLSPTLHGNEPTANGCERAAKNPLVSLILEVKTFLAKNCLQ
jgi:hypothetical protein